MTIRRSHRPAGKPGSRLLVQQQGNCCNTRTVFGFDAYDEPEQVRGALDCLIRGHLEEYDEDRTYYDIEYGEFLYIEEEDYDRDPERYMSGGPGVWMAWVAADQIPMCHEALLEVGFELIAQNIYNPNSGNVCNMYMGITPACAANNEGQLPKALTFRHHCNHEEYAS